LRYVDTDVERARWRATANVRILPTLQVGAEFNLVVEEINPLVTWFLFTESQARPALFLGTSSDRIGSPKGEQSWYLTLAKHVPRWPLSGYVSLNYSEWDEGFNVPFGVTVGPWSRFSVRPMYDGERAHLMVNADTDRVTMSFLWVWYEQAGVSLAVGF
jgi:hypothetical protein